MTRFIHVHVDDHAVKVYSVEEIVELTAEYDADQIAILNRWLQRGDGIAVYRNEDLGHPEIGHIQLLSYGSPQAQLETEKPPTRLPDIGGAINWRYQLAGVYRGEQLPTTKEADHART